MKIYPATKKSKVREYELTQILLSDKYRRLLEDDRSTEKTLRKLATLIYHDINKTCGLEDINA